MTRKDYVVLAEAVRGVDNLYRVADNREARQAIALVVDELAATLYRDNPNFDGRRFRAACGVLS